MNSHTENTVAGAVAADLLAFAQALAGGFRKAMNAALLSAVPTLAGTST